MNDDITLAARCATCGRKLVVESACLQGGRSLVLAVLPCGCVINRFSNKEEALAFLQEKCRVLEKELALARKGVTTTPSRVPPSPSSDPPGAGDRSQAPAEG